MVKEATRKCSNCGKFGHNLRTCLSNKGGLKLFGVQIPMKKEQEKVVKKSSSTENLKITSGNSGPDSDDDGYLSDGLPPTNKKGNLWTKEEHQLFLTGLKVLGRGEWKEIAKRYVTSKSSSQVASHAQKHFLRLAASEEKKIRPSVFDVPLQEAVGVDENGQVKFAAGSSIPIVVYAYGLVIINFTNPTYMYLNNPPQPQAHVE